MDGQELYNLHEAYMDVYAEETNSIPLPGETRRQFKRHQKRNQELLDAREKRKKDRQRNKNPLFFGKDGKMTKTQKEQVDLYDIILSHLLDEGYAETLEAAEAMMVNMSEEWRDSILEKKRQYDDGHGFDRSKHDDLEIDYDRPRGKTEDPGYPGYTRIKHKPSGIEYEIQHSKKHGENNMSTDLKGKARKAHGHKPEHNIRWSHDREIEMTRKGMSRGDRIKTARNAKRVWDKHIQHRIPSGHLVSNDPDENYDEKRKDPEKNTRASIYQRSGFGKTNRMGRQYSTKIGKKLHPVNDDED